MISIFFAFSMLLVLALLGTLLEGANIHYEKNLAQRRLHLSAQAALSKYDNRLWEEYHLFLVNGRNHPKETIGATMKEYLELNHSGGEHKITGLVGATDYQGALLANEIIEYMKYKEPSKLFQKRDTVEQELNKAIACADITGEEMQAFKELENMEKEELKVIALVEGIRIDEKGLLFGDKRSTNQAFAKRICPVPVTSNDGRITSDAVGIDSLSVFEKNRSRYRNPYLTLREMEQKLRSGTGEMPNPEAADGIPPTVSKSADNFRKEIKDTRSAIEEALKVIGQMDDKLRLDSKRVQKKIQKYEEVLDKSTGDIYEKQRKDMEKSGRMDTASMKAILERNETILNQIDNRLTNDILSEGSSKQDALTAIEDIKTYLQGYDVSGLCFNYGEEKKENPLESLQNLFDGTLFELVGISKEEISKKKVKKLALAQISGEDVEVGDETRPGDFLKTSDVVEMAAAVKELCEGIVEDTKAGKLAVAQMLDDYLMLEYYKDHFKNYTEEKTSQTVLMYELEAMASGCKSDEKALGSVLSKMLCIRMLCNYGYLLTDSAKQAQAEATALAVVGFTGIEPLVMLVKQLILIAWGLTEALVDVRALVSGYSVNVLKNASNFRVKYSDLFAFSKTMLKNKARLWKGNNMGFTYVDYLLMFMRLRPKKKVLGSAAGLIELNMREQGEKDFRMKNGIFGCNVSLEEPYEAKFLQFPFINQMIHKDLSGNKLRIRESVCY